jgi:hypothetical protein
MPYENRALLLAVIMSVVASSIAKADPAPFDLAGPIIEAKITRDGNTLPITQVPNLAVGDRLWIKADLPPTQSAHYIMVAAFLRGATNPPPKEWFFNCETWSKPCAQGGLNVTVPAGAQQLMLFLAPETGGDFKTLVNTVRGRPGAFVRASQDLNQMTLDRARLDAYMAALRSLDASDPNKIKDAAPLLARSLAIKLDDKCLDRLAQVQAPCLTQGQNSLILNDGHSTSIVEALTNGPASDLAMEASFTPQLSYGFYSPYIASVLDIARILDSFHIANYQYIPALASQQNDRLGLALNAPPSFNNPKSVLVVALPAIEHVQLPPLHAVDPAEIYCAQRSPLVLSVDGAPLAFATGYAHDMSVKISGADGRGMDLPAHADPQRGGYVIDSRELAASNLGDGAHGTLHGAWGFEKYEGPSFQLANSPVQKWALASADEGALIVGREDTVHLQSGNAACVAAVMLKDSSGRTLPAAWKAVNPSQIEVTLAMQQAKPGALTLLVGKYGAGEPQAISLHAYSEAARLDSLELHAGDGQGFLRGTRLDQVATLTVKGSAFTPGKLASSQGVDQLPVAAVDSTAIVQLKQGDAATVHVTLKDGRALELPAVIDAPRPRVALIGKSVQPSVTSGSSHIQLASQDELPKDARLTFSLRTQFPAVFSYDEKIEVAAVANSGSTTLSFDNGGITLVDAEVAVATLDPGKAFGPSTFGPLQYRVVTRDAVGDWQPLATLIRLPTLSDLKCPATRELACKLSGSSLYLVESVSADPQFDHPTQVPDGFPGYALPVPRPTEGQLYVKLRDAPAIVNPTSLVTQQLPPSPDEIARAATRHEAAASSGDPTSHSSDAAPSASPAPPPSAPAPTAAPAASPTSAPAPLPSTPPPTPAPAGTPAAAPAPAPSTGAVSGDANAARSGTAASASTAAPAAATSPN